MATKIDQQTRHTATPDVQRGPRAAQHSVRSRRIGPWTVIAAWAAVLLTALAVATVVIVEVVSDEAPVEQTVAEAVPVADEATALARLVAHGYIPREALEPIRDVTDDLVNRGLVPNRAWHAPLYSQEELVTLQLVRSGDLPVETTQSDDWVTRRLIARGQIPRAAAD